MRQGSRPRSATLVKDYPAPLEIETTPTTWSCVDRGGGYGIGIGRAN